MIASLQRILPWMNGFFAYLAWRLGGALARLGRRKSQPPYYVQRTGGGSTPSAILIVQVGRIGRKALRRAKFLLDHAKANVLGVVLTNVSAEIAPEYSYLDYQYR